MNERTHFFIKIFLSHFIPERVTFLVGENWVETRTDCYFEPSSSDHSSTYFSSWLGCSTVGHWGPKALCLPLALTSASCPPLTWTVCALSYNIVWHPPASAVLPLIYKRCISWRLGRGSIYNTWPQGTVSSGLCPLRWKWVYCFVPEAAHSRNANGIMNFFLPAAHESRFMYGPHHKTTLYHTLTQWYVRQIPSYPASSVSSDRYTYTNCTTMTRKPGKHFVGHTEQLNSCFDLIKSYQQCTPWSPPREIEPAITEPKLYHWATGSYRT